MNAHGRTFLAALIFSSSLQAQPFTWFWDSNWPQPHDKYPSPEAACEGYLQYGKHVWPSPEYLVKPKNLKLGSVSPAIRYDCNLTLFYWDALFGTYLYITTPGTAIYREGDTCPAGTMWDGATYSCQDSTVSFPAKQRGKDENQVCGAQSESPGSFINAAIGNIYQSEPDFSVSGASPISFARHYNSNSGLWNHTYSTHVVFDSFTATLVDASGRQASFSISNGVAVSEVDHLGKLEKMGANWVYTSPSNETQTFNGEGRLIGTKARNGVTQALTYTPQENLTLVRVNDSLGNSLSFTQDDRYRAGQMHTTGLDITYFYNGPNQFYRVDRTRNNQLESRTYLYEVPEKPNLMTGIVDERGIRIATWAYDVQDRVISSEQAGAAGKRLITYNADGSSTVTNELGKQTTYRYEVIQSVKHITSVEGEPSANCPASNSTFTYNDRGQVLTQTDAKGFVTTHTYNDRGLETTRTQASGTPQARTTTTTWHATFNLPLTVTEGGQVTTYTYDTQGRQTSRTQTAL